jgi:hypothetical protein
LFIACASPAHILQTISFSRTAGNGGLCGMVVAIKKQWGVSLPRPSRNNIRGGEAEMMRRTNLATVLAALLMIFSTTALAARPGGGDDPDTRLTDAKVVEVADDHISVIAKTGVEHVIAIDDSGTKVMIDEEFVSLKDLRVGDVVTVELDTYNPLKFAMSIEISSQANSQVARTKP